LIGNLIHGFKDDGESGSFAQLTLNVNTATHLLDNQFANAESKPSALWILFPAFLEISEVDKQIFQLLFRDPVAKILNTQNERDVTSLLTVLDGIF
jgi:hypothetical protein